MHININKNIIKYHIEFIKYNHNICTVTEFTREFSSHYCETPN
jgi:hypothetical protein